MTSKIISIFDSIPILLLLLPIILCSIVVLAIFIERMIFYRKINLDYRLILNNVVDNIKSKKIDNALRLCENYQGPIVELVIDFLNNWDHKKNKDLLIIDISEKTIRKIEKFAGTISTISTISPMLGLFGTVVGMMQSFSALSQLGPAASDQLAQGITVALITTAMGLLVAIPSIMFYNYMVARSEYFVREIEFVANSLQNVK